MISISKNGLVINQVNISSYIQIISTKFPVTVFKLPFSYFIFKHFNTQRVLISIGIMLQTFDAKYLNEFKPNFVVLMVFPKKIVCDLKL